MGVVKDETPQGWVGALISARDAIASHPWRTLVALPFLMLMLLVTVMAWNAPALIELYERVTNRHYEREVLDKEMRDHAVEVDEQIRNRLLRLRFQTTGSRAVVRAFVFDMNQSEQIRGIVDVFESMDLRTEQTGIRTRPLPLTAIQQTMNYMLASDSPRCIANNTQDYDDPELRDFLTAAGLKASVACPLRDMDGKPIGLLAVSIRTELKDNPVVRPLTRDAALEIGAYLTFAKSYIDAVRQHQEALE